MPRSLTCLMLAAAVTACDVNSDEVHPRAEYRTGAGRVRAFDEALVTIVPADAAVEKLATGFVFTEGPVWVASGEPYLLFSDLEGNAIYRWSPDHSLEPLLKPFNRGQRAGIGPNGLTLDAEGGLIICDHGERRLARMEMSSEPRLLVDRYRGQRFNSPNDAVFRSDGALYFTDPPYGLAGEDDDPDKELEFNGVFRFRPTGELDLLTTAHTRPNGIAFAPDEQTLYVANSDSVEQVIVAHSVLADGSLGTSRVFVDLTNEPGDGVPDGLKVDRAGNVYATGPGGVWILDADGKRLGKIELPEVAANLAWGDEGGTLYITASTGLYRIRLNTVGIRP